MKLLLQALPSLIDGGTAFNEALHGIIILGKVIKASVIPPTKEVDLGNSNTLRKFQDPKVQTQSKELQLNYLY